MIALKQLTSQDQSIFAEEGSGLEEIFEELTCLRCPEIAGRHVTTEVGQRRIPHRQQEDKGPKGEQGQKKEKEQQQQQQQGTNKRGTTER
jgi:hypothetical protein